MNEEGKMKNAEAETIAHVALDCFFILHSSFCLSPS
jgi:hypothetical protein